MKTLRTLLLALILLEYCLASNAQAKKPTIMVVPSDVWCNLNGCMLEFRDDEQVIKIPDYKRAFQENSDLLAVISKINGLMADRGFPLKNMESCIKSLDADAAENDMITSKESGAEASESPVDKLKKVAKADIIMQLTWTVNETGPQKSVTFNLQGLDSYTDKQIATAVGTGDPSFAADVPTLLEEAVLAHIDNFNASLQTYFDDLFANGREVTISIKKWDDWPNDLETEYDGKELNEIIEDWMTANCVKGRFSTTDATENRMLFEQVRIPLYDAKGQATDTRRWARGLSKFLAAAPYNITNKLTTKGLGSVTLYLGSK